MRKHIITFLILVLLFSGCGNTSEPAHIAATTLPVYEFTAALCEGTPITVTRLVTEQVSCLHDYSLNVNQVRAAEAAEMIVISGAGLEDFFQDVLAGTEIIDTSQGIQLICPEEAHDHDDEHEHDHRDHSHDRDPHIWLAPENAIIMARNICAGLTEKYPEHQTQFQRNLDVLVQRLQDLQSYGQQQLASLSCQEIITFHDGFAYFAQSFDLHIIRAIEEESGSEASAQELKELITLVRDHNLPAIFTEKAGSISAASIVAAETDTNIYNLDMAMAGDSYFDAMYHNIDTIKEALQ